PDQPLRPGAHAAPGQARGDRGGLPVPGLRRRLGHHGHQPDRGLRPDRELVHPRDDPRGLTVPVAEGTLAGWRSVVLEGRGLRATVLPERGAEITPLVHVPSGTELLFQAPWGLEPPGAPPRAGSDGHLFLERYAGGWQELFPSCNDACTYRGQAIPFHGE